MYDFTIIAVGDGYGTSVAATIDLLEAAASLAPRFGDPVPRWRICSADGGEVRFRSGMRVDTAKLAIHSRTDMSTWIVPGLGIHSVEAIQERAKQPDLALLVEGLQQHHKRGGSIAAGCSSVFLLELAGVLNDKRVTTTWWLASALKRMNPSIRMHADRMVCADGAIVTAGAAFAQTDLMLHLLRKACGAQTVDAVSRFLLVDARDAQAAYVVPEVLANGDALVGKIVSRIERALPDAPAISQLAKEFCVSERTLARRVQRTTGRSPLALLQSVRLRKARALLEQSRMSVEQVAAAVGYSDPTALRRLMKKVGGMKPSQFRAAAY